MSYPDWVLKQKRKRTLIMKRGDNYYLYRVRSVWDKERKRTRLKTEEYLGKIMPEGLMEPRVKRVMKRYDQITVKEYGASFLLQHISGDIVQSLEDFFPEWREIFVFSCMRLIHRSPMKNVEFHYRSSFLSEAIRDARVSPDSLGDMLRSIGMDRSSITGFMKSFMKDERYLAVDLTHILSMSEGVISATLGHNSKGEHLPQIQLLFLFSIGRDAPAYFRILPGAINSVMSLRVTMQESGASNIVLVADTGFYSSKNVNELDDMGIFFIIPLKRNSKLIDYTVEQGRHFMFQDHPIFYSKYQSNGRSMFTFRNDFLKAEEEKDYLRRHEKVTAAFRNISGRMGTISVITNLKASGEIVYQMLKSRADIEQSYDTFKNTIHADRTYMRDDHQLQGWMFVNFIALVLHYRIYSMLKEKGLLKRYSPEDVIEHLERISMLKIGDEWKISEIPKKSRDIIDELGIPIIQKAGVRV
ncbi:MAG: transposase [Thermoplasmatales archaeon]|nr:transposase [Thermoplasmatales archaeon]